jgi:hypothetical protein
MSATLPLCAACNHNFGAQLEGPVSAAFEDLEARRGIADEQAELLIRWLWKYEGIFWSAENVGRLDALYSDRWTLKERGLASHPSAKGEGGLAAARARRANLHAIRICCSSFPQRTQLYFKTNFSAVTCVSCP